MKMSSTIKSKHDKKINVVNRTTSETLRLGETDGFRVASQTNSSHSIQTLPAVSRKKIQNSSSSFQITGVSLTRSDFGDDSADDLDESHTDDISRVTDNETPSFSEDSRDTDEHPVYEAPTAPATQVCGLTQKELMMSDPPKDQSAPKPPEEDAGARFKVVKMPSVVPFTRGRWTCFDYLDNSKLNVSYIYSEQKFVKQGLDNQIPRPSYKAPYAQGELAPSVYVVQQSAPDLSSNRTMEPGKAFTQGYFPISSGEGLVGQGQMEAGEFLVGPQLGVAGRQSAEGDQKVKDHTHDILSDIKVALPSTCVPSDSGLDRESD